MAISRAAGKARLIRARSALRCALASGNWPRSWRTDQLEHNERALLRNVPEPWPFPSHARVAPLVAALDLAESGVRACLSTAPGNWPSLATGIVTDWQHRPPRRRPVRPLISTNPRVARKSSPSRRD
jgi:hypothetical protein